MAPETSTSATTRATVNLTPPTLRLLRSFKALMEWVRGEPISFDEATRFATLMANFQITKELGITKEKDFSEWAKGQIEKVSGDLTPDQVRAIIEEVEAFGVK